MSCRLTQAFSGTVATSQYDSKINAYVYNTRKYISTVTPNDEKDHAWPDVNVNYNEAQKEDRELKVDSYRISDRNGKQKIDLWSAFNRQRA